MTALRLQRDEVLAAAASGGWAAVFLSPDWVAAAVLAPVYAAAVLPFRRAPVVAGYGVVVAAVVQWALGVSGENPAGIVAVVLTVFSLGRNAGPVAGGLPVLALAVTMSARDGFAAPTVVFVAVLLAALWSAGRLVRLRAERAAAAAGTAAELARTDPRRQAEALVAEERGRLAGETLAVIRTAVQSMQAQARQAEQALDPAALAGIQSDGRRAVAELRRLLGLLRSEPAATAAPPRPERRIALRAAAWPVDALVAAVLCAMVLVEAQTIAEGVAVSSVVLTLGLCTVVTLRRTWPTVACLVGLLPLGLAIALGTSLLHGFEAAIVPALLAWSVGAEGRTHGVAALLSWLLVAVVEVRLHDPGNEALLLAIVLAGAGAGQLWGRRREQERTALRQAEGLRVAHAVLADRALREERLRLARELHDVASHAIGVMVLQAAAAEVQRKQDTAAARAALAAVRTAGGQALAELAVLFGLLDAGAVGAPGLAATAPATDVVGAVRTLVQRVRAGGLAVEFTVRGDLAGDVAPAGTAYRVVQEALTNAARHAPDSRVRVALGLEGDRLTVDIRNDGPAGDPSAGEGFGLVGLAERVRAEGGSIAAGPGPDGGFAVCAQLPLRHPEPRPPAEEFR